MNKGFTFGGLIFFILIVYGILNDAGNAGASEGEMKSLIIIGFIAIIVAIFFYNIFKK